MILPSLGALPVVWEKAFVAASCKRKPQPHLVMIVGREKERKKDILTSFKRPKWPIRPNKRLHLKCCLVFENSKSKNK